EGARGRPATRPGGAEPRDARHRARGGDLGAREPDALALLLPHGRQKVVADGLTDRCELLLGEVDRRAPLGDWETAAEPGELVDQPRQRVLDARLVAAELGGQHLLERAPNLDRDGL